MMQPIADKGLDYNRIEEVVAVARSAAEDRAIRKYEREKIDKIMIRVPKGMKETIQNFASERGASLNRYILRAVCEAMERDKASNNEVEK